MRIVFSERAPSASVITLTLTVCGDPSGNPSIVTGFWSSSTPMIVANDSSIIVTLQDETVPQNATIFDYTCSGLYPDSAGTGKMISPLVPIELTRPHPPTPDPQPIPKPTPPPYGNSICLRTQMLPNQMIDFGLVVRIGESGSYSYYFFDPQATNDPRIP